MGSDYVAALQRELVACEARVEQVAAMELVPQSVIDEANAGVAAVKAELKKAKASAGNVETLEKPKKA